MLVLNARGRSPGTEKRALEWLGDASAPGVAVSSVHLAGARGRGREADLIVITPAGVGLVEIKGLIRRLPAPVLHTGANRRWAADGISGDPVHVGAGDMSPFDQASARMYDLKNALGGGVRVSAAVLVMAHPGTTLQIEHTGPRPYDMGILTGNDPAELLAWLDTLGGRGQNWTAERTITALAALGVAPPTVAELAAAGFASDGTTPDLAGALPNSAGNRRGGRFSRRSAARFGSPTPRARSPRRRSGPAPRRQYRPRRQRGSIGAAVLGLAVALLGATGIAAVLMLSGIAAEVGSPTRPTPTTAEVGTAPAPAPEPPQVCYPFQPC